MTEPELIVRSTDLHELRYCMRGARRWFASHGIDWSAFVRNGIPAAQLDATGDALALKLTAHVRARSVR